ncbi:16S rRNA (guanine966-N2)-methyltransferase [Thermoleophilum album]|uniref:16S rRNA (Guanine966-N2)-methyltransferase n=1 Tax=Thermoleophilum album TaxID=29539 RepID=A0A1H6FZQ1_THEAL|nr:16S rRNA (guanine966-N2)-methyltransferase [Thermoleophilum album]
MRLPGGAVRPTQQRVREALFALLGPLEGRRVLDLFAGSGALAIEALSRGAASAVLVERDARALTTIKANLRSLQLRPPLAVVRAADARRYLASRQGREDAPFDVVFCDPPYDSASQLAATIDRRLAPLLAEDAVIVTESHRHAPLELGFEPIRQRRYGDTLISLYRASGRA